MYRGPVPAQAEQNYTTTPPRRIEPKCTPLHDLDAGFEGNFRPTMVTDGMGVITDDIAQIAEKAFAGKLSA